MSQLPPFTIVSVKYIDMLDDTGDDIVFFELQLEINKQLYNTNFPFSVLTDYLRQTKPADEAYFKKIRSSINGFGPKETVMLKIALEEGYDFKTALAEYIASTDSMDGLYPVNKTQSASEHAELKKHLSEYETIAREGKSFVLRNVQLQDEVMDLLNKKVLEIYPEILNSRPEYITELQDLLINHVLNFGEDINDLAWKAYKQP